MRQLWLVVTMWAFAAVMLVGAAACSRGYAADEPTPAPDGSTPTALATATGTGTPEPTGTSGPTVTVEEGPSSFVYPLTRQGFGDSTGYVVQPGDTLHSIASATGIDVEVIAARNKLPVLAPLRPGDTIFIPNPTPTPLPTPTPTSTPTPTPTPSATPVPTGPSKVVYNGPRTSGQVALTFDMDGRAGTSESIVRWLVRNRVAATIFVTGGQVETTAFGREVVRLVDANRDLLELGSHSYSHPALSTLSDAAIREQLRATERAVARYSDVPVRPFLRPPYGAWNQRVLAVAGAMGYSKTVLWDVDPEDWRQPPAWTIRDRVLSNARGGSIVLMHLHGLQTEAALPGIVSGLRQRGYELVTVSELLD